jgi:hypothetical protein
MKALAVVVLCLLVAVVVLACYTVSRLDTGVYVPPHPLMGNEGYVSPAEGPVVGEIFITDASPMRDEWRLVVDNWPVFLPYTSETLYYDRTSMNHEVVQWNVLDASLFFLADEALLIYNIDGTTYLAWGRKVRSECYGGATKWWFGHYGV